MSFRTLLLGKFCMSYLSCRVFPVSDTIYYTAKIRIAEAMRIFVLYSIDY